MIAMIYAHFVGMIVTASLFHKFNVPYPGFIKGAWMLILWPYYLPENLE